MKRTLAMLVPVAAAVTLSASAAVTPTVKMATNAELGQILVSSAGHTLYHLTSEKAGKVTCTGACAKLWPPLLVKAGTKPVAGSGLTATRLTTVKRPDGTLQVAYRGFALYRYAGDTKAGDAKGEGASKSWYALDSTGAIVKPSATSPAPSTSSGNTGSTSGGSTPPTSSGGTDYSY